METTKIKKKAGRISPTPMGDYDNTTTYRRLDWVYYGGTSYICKKNNTLGISPADTDKWQKIIELPTELKMIFDEATTRENIISGEKLSVILGKIQKCITDIKDIAFTGSYNDLSDKPTSLKNPNALTIKFNGTTQSTYDGSIKKEVDVTPSVIAAVPATNVLTSKEQVLANTNASNIASAVALKNINNDLVNNISAINSNLTKKDGSTQCLNPCTDLNIFYNGTGLFSGSTKNLPISDWCFVTSAGASGTVSQIAKVIWSDTTYKRFCAAGEWTGWTEYKPVPNNIVLFSGFNISNIRMGFNNELDAICLYINWTDGEGGNRSTIFKCHSDSIG